MPWIVSHADELKLPEYNPRKDNSPPPAESALVRTPNGYFDKYGRGNNAPVALRPIPISGLLWGDPEILVDETGDPLVDENGDTLIEAANSLRSQLDALGRKVETRVTLWRESMDDGTRQFKSARFQQLDAPQDVKDRDFKVAVTCIFEPFDAYWHAEEATVYSGSVTAGTSLTFIVENDGKTITNAVLTVTCTSGTITAVTMTCTELGISWSWTGTLDVDEMLTVDAGSGEISEDATASFGGFTLFGSAKGYMPIPQGIWLIQIATIGGDGDVALTFHEQYS